MILIRKNLDFCRAQSDMYLYDSSPRSNHCEQNNKNSSSFFFVHLQSISNEPEKHFTIPIVFYFYAIFITFLYEEKAQVFLSLTMKFEIENQFTQTATMFAFANISLKKKNLY